jgi:putative spermidine/putrescine transport system permease protein
LKNKVIISIFILVTAAPLLGGIVYIVLYSLGLTGLIAQEFTMSYWQSAFDSSEMLVSIAYSVWISAATTLCSVVLALIFLYFYRPKARAATPYYLFFPLSIPYMVMGFFSFQLLSASGLLSRVAFQLGFTDSINGFPELVSEPYGIGIIFSHVFLAAPFFTIMFLNIYQNEKLPRLLDISSSLGTGYFFFFSRVTIPLVLRKALPFLMIYTIVFAGSYEIPLLLGVQSPEMISVFIVRKLQKFNLMDIPVAYVATTVYALIVVLTVFIFGWTYLRKEVSHG